MSEYQDIYMMLDANAITNVVDAYKKGREIAEEEHKAMCETCIHKVSAEDIKALQESAIDELASFLTNDWGLDIMLTYTDKESLKSFILHNADQVKMEF